MKPNTVRLFESTEAAAVEGETDSGLPVVRYHFNLTQASRGRLAKVILALGGAATLTGYVLHILKG